jgi:hypothetical protein
MTSLFTTLTERTLEIIGVLNVRGHYSTFDLAMRITAHIKLSGYVEILERAGTISLLDPRVPQHL